MQEDCSMIGERVIVSTKKSNMIKRKEQLPLSTRTKEIFRIYANCNKLCKLLNYKDYDNTLKQWERMVEQHQSQEPNILESQFRLTSGRRTT